ncbi:hypothetical protein GPROT2_00428 [Gammaproteobacteria bacterium]|nr:hypothetical protein [Gammaproteobacteria bacterium]QOJ31166.1 MAG: hypothetical protein HRU81_03055 [Gammaproteobacteria bacterium]CAG0938871.1 hypothetical protein GPROT2_00428 [Gammaproteobacteria bacterium]
MTANRTIRLALAVLASGASLALSWPYWRDFGYWAESRGMWLGYFIVGFLLAVYVFCVFFSRLGTLFEHDAIAREQRSGAARAEGGEKAP